MEQDDNNTVGEMEAAAETADVKESGKEGALVQGKGKKGGGRPRMALGIAIILVGICVCLYPLYRQKKSDDFNKDAINRILTPQPEKKEQPSVPAASGAPGASEVPTIALEITPGITQAVPTVPDEGQDTQGQGTAEENPEMPGEELVENPETLEQDEANEKQENENRLNGKTLIGVIQIPKIELVYAIVEGADAAEIGVAIGHMSDTAKLGEIGNCALAGHRGGYSGPYFKNLDKLEIGDEVIITDTKQQVFTYKVTETMVVEPEEVWVIEDTGEEVAMLTLITCENDGTQRLIVRCVVQ